MLRLTDEQREPDQRITFQKKTFLPGRLAANRKVKVFACIEGLRSWI